MVTDLFTVLEQKLEMVLGQTARLKESQYRLEETLAEKEQALKEAAGRPGEAVPGAGTGSERIDKILNRLKIIDTGESA